MGGPLTAADVYCVTTKAPRVKPMKKRTTMKAQGVVTKHIQKTAGAQSIRKQGSARLGPRLCMFRA